MPTDEIVIDSNVALNLVFRRSPYHAQAGQLFADCLQAATTLLAPPVFESEVDSAIRRKAFLGHIDASAERVLFQALDSLPVAIVLEPGMRDQSRIIAWKCSQTTVYDATYAALAGLRQCELWTADQAFFRAAHSHYPFVRFLGDY